MNKLFNILASFGLTVILLIFMFLIILFGTLYQVDHGLYAAQQKYFDSVYVMHELGPLTIPLPGAYILMVVFSINLLCGGLIRIRKGKGTIGILISHIGIVVMLISCALTFHFADRGHMRLFETQASNEFSSYVDWTIEIGKPGVGAEQFIIDDDDFSDLEGDKSRTFYNDAIPFDIKLHSFSRNAFVSPVRPMISDNLKIVDEFFIDPMKPEKQAEQNMPAIYIEVIDSNTDETVEAILWGMSRNALTVNVDGEPWLIDLTRERWNVPFLVTLDEFIHEKYAGTQMAKSYESYITKTENGEEETIRIWMNHPLRYKGYTFFQESWGPPNAAPGEPLYSQFAVVRNPGDQGPLYACIIISIGLLLHFILKLLAYMRLEAKRRSS
ncbi:MAG: cytochrome c biogenesis protein ResB [Candidatus Hydrogenedentota bacterium]